MEGVSFWSILKSRKFWVMVLAIVTAASLFATQQIDGWQFMIAVITSIAAYSTGVAIEDAGQKIGMSKLELNKIPVQPINLTVGMAEPRQSVKQNTSGIMGQSTENLTGSPSSEGRNANLSGSRGREDMQG